MPMASAWRTAGSLQGSKLLFMPRYSVLRPPPSSQLQVRVAADGLEVGRADVRDAVVVPAVSSWRRAAGSVSHLRTAVAVAAGSPQ